MTWAPSPGGRGAPSPGICDGGGREGETGGRVSDRDGGGQLRQQGLVLLSLGKLGNDILLSEAPCRRRGRRGQDMKCHGRKRGQGKKRGHSRRRGQGRRGHGRWRGQVEDNHALSV